MTIQTVTLSKLVASKKNVRRKNAEAGIEGLAADISTHGILQNLVVEPSETQKGKYEVVAGGRRLKALKHLQKAKGAIKGVLVTPSFPVQVRVLEEGEDIATAVSLSENFQRSAMHPADEIAAFRTLNVEQALSPEEIADKYGISHMTVRRRLKLANLSPRVLEALRDATLAQFGLDLYQGDAGLIRSLFCAENTKWYRPEEVRLYETRS